MALPLQQLSLALLLLAGLCSCEDEERLIGWKGDTFGTNPESQTSSTSSSGRRRDPWIETISWNPRAFVYHNFLTPEECEHLTSIGQKRVSRSLVVDAKTGSSKLDDIRTSYGAAFGRGEDPVIATIEQKIAEWTHLPPENGEPIQILRYVDGQKYDAHWDWFDDPLHHKSFLVDGNRYATVLLYLSDQEPGGGGETALPLADAIDAEAQKIDQPSECASRMGIAVQPHKGDALLFFDMDIEGTKGDRAALHASCPTTKGTKWTATKWIHNKRYMGSYNALEAAGQCKDLDYDCAARTARGECDSKAETMLGQGGRCRKTCQDCTPCARDDILCYRRNMRSLRHANTQGGAAHHGKDGAPT